MLSPHQVTALQELVAVAILCLSVARVEAAARRAQPEDVVAPGACSNQCEKSETVAPVPYFHFQCSCSSSCSLYGDCCYDSPSKSEGEIEDRPRTVCLPLYRKGRFEAVASCPANWNGTSEFCTESAGHLPPVTSIISGATYANFHCALCNSDVERLTVWKVDIKCCSEHDDSSDVKYVFSGKELWSQMKPTDGSRKSPLRCLCRFVPRPDAKDFAKALELRRCGAKTEIAACSPWWKDKQTESQCKSYIDPVYHGDKVYRNSHCAKCNFENLRDSRCRPSVVDEIFMAGAKYGEARKLCEALGLRACVHFLGSGRGRKYAFSELFTTWEMKCVPAQGRRCCEGEKYDFRHKTCRKVKSRLSRFEGREESAIGNMED